jgi:hypothetical protein
MKRTKSLLFALLCCPLLILAQQNTISPYSSFGIGQFQNQGFALNNALGGIGIALRSNNQLNLVNPASVSALTLTSFEVGASGTSLFLKDANYEQESFSSSLSYLSLGFPLAKGFGVSAGLLPYSFKGYQVTKTSEFINATDTLQTNTEYVGSGGLNRAYFNLGANVYKGFSLGLTVNMIFGTLKEQRDLWSEEPNFINSRDENNYTVKDASFDVGAQYQTMYKDKQLIFGATYTPQTSLDASNSGAIYTYNIVNNFEYIRDTTSVNETLTSGLRLPMSYGAAVSLGKENNWFVSGEYEFKEWSQLTLFGAPSPEIKNASQIKLGAWIIPNNKDVHHYWKSIQYRMGLNFNTGYLAASELNSNTSDASLNDLSISLGFALPLKRSNTIVNIGAQFGKRGTVDNNLVEEKYIKLHLAFTFNDKWFTQRKID